MEYIDLRLGFRIDSRNYIPHSVVVVRNSNAWYYGVNSRASSVNLVYKPVKAYLRLGVNQAESTRKGYTKVVQPYDLEKGKPLIVSFVGIVIELDLWIQSPLLLTLLVRPK